MSFGWTCWRSLVSRMVGSSCPRSWMKSWRKRGAGQHDRLLVDARRAVLAGRDVQFDRAPGRAGSAAISCEQLGGAAPQGDEGDAQLRRAGPGWRRWSVGIEDQVARHAPRGALPEVDEAEDLLGLLALAQIGIGVAEGSACRHPGPGRPGRWAGARLRIET